MSDNHQRYQHKNGTFTNVFCGARRLNVQASLISGIVGSRSANYPKIASKVPDRRKLESRVKGYSRYVNARKPE
jgi:hypothetical protein